MNYKRIKKISAILTTLFLLFIFMLPLNMIAKENTPSSYYINGEDNVLQINGYINDYAGILSGDTKEKIEEKGSELNKKDGTQLVFITVDTLKGKDIRDVAYKTFNYYHLGDKDNNNGVLFIVERNGEHNYYMEVGTGLEGVLTDIESSHLQKDYLVSNFKNGDFDKGILELYQQTANVIQNPDVAATNANKNSEDIDEGFGVGHSDVFLILLFIFSPFYLLLILAILLSKRTPKRIEVTLGKTTELPNARVNKYEYTSLTPNIATIDEWGFIRGVNVGKETIVRRNKKNGKESNIDVYVNKYVYVSSSYHSPSSNSHSRSSYSSHSSSSYRSSGSSFNSGGSNHHSSFSGGGGHSAGGGSGNKW